MKLKKKKKTIVENIGIKQIKSCYHIKSHKTIMKIELSDKNRREKNKRSITIRNWWTT